MTVEWIHRVAAALDRAVQDFDPDELAFLALTGKIELTLRDRLAWETQGSWPSPPAFTAREWKKTDLAVIENGQPIVLLEAKALYSFDAANPVTLAKYESYTHDDIAKARKLAVPETQIMVAVFMTHVAAPVPDHLDKIVKYRFGINKALAQFGARPLREFAVNRVESILRPVGPTKRVTPSPTGTAFDIPAQVDAWVTHANAQ